MSAHRLAAAVLLGAGLALPSAAQDKPEPELPKTQYTKEQRERAIARCQAQRGTDCETDAGLQEWLLLERSRDEAEQEGSRSIHQNVPRPTPRGN